MADEWKKFESACYEYLCKEYGGNAKIIAYGKSDSSKADIEINTVSNNIFYVEIKSKKSQCCQFVLFPNDTNKCFEVSAQVKSPDTTNRRAIIEYMNNEYAKFSKVTSTGIPINIKSDILYSWVNDFYKSKNVKYFMTKGKKYIIFPIEKIADYFDISAIYRNKGSGSNNPSKKNNLTEIEEGLQRESLSGQIEFVKINAQNKCFIHTTYDINKKSIYCSKYTYLFKANEYSAKITPKDNFVYEVRRLSNTNNPNVICKLSLKQNNQSDNDLIIFENEIK